jgi:outer membrane protein assembly factor BamE (lipoprotein component of BamABCDE complex)
MLNGFKYFPALGLTLALAAACAPVVDIRGNMPDADLLSEIKEGATTREQVQEKLGSPTSIATFDDNVWYYISKKTQQTAFFDPKVLEQRVLVLRFSDTGRLAEMKSLTLDDAQEVNLVRRFTPTAGQDLGILEQLVGNLGRFNADERTGRIGRSGGRS